MSSNMVMPEVPAELRNPRRGRERVDGLEYLRRDEPLVVTEADGSAMSDDLSNPRMIAHDLMLLIYYTLILARFNHATLEIQTKLYVKGLQDLIEEEGFRHITSNSHRPVSHGLRDFVQNLSDDEVLKVIQKKIFDPYLSRLFNNGIETYSVHNTRKKFVENTKPELLEVPATARNQNPINFVTDVTHEWSTAFILLRRSFEAALDLRTHVRVAIDCNELNRESMSALRLKMRALNDRFYDASLLLGHDPPRHNLVWEGEQWWLPPDEQTVPAAFQDSTPKNVVQAYQTSPNVNSALTVLVPVTVLFSTIPMALSWYHSSGDSGTLSDPDFWQLVASSVIQILGVVTLIIPTIFNIRLAKMAWLWTWIFASLSVCCSIAAPPLYLSLPAKWSVMILFGGSLAQTFITLQLMFTI